MELFELFTHVLNGICEMDTFVLCMIILTVIWMVGFIRVWQ